MSENDAVDKSAEPGDPSTEEELTDEELNDLDGGDGGQVTYPPYL
jgi:hypothetical protein